MNDQSILFPPSGFDLRYTADILETVITHPCWYVGRLEMSILGRGVMECG